jgi:N-acetylglucosamine-6-sulfatase
MAGTVVWRGAAGVVALGLTVGTGLGVPAPAAGREAGAPRVAVRPNVVVVQTDDQELTSMWAMPQTVARLGDAGVTFTQDVATYPVCCPSRASMLSGQYAFRHGVYSNSYPLGGYLAFDHTNALPVWLQSAGYRTIHVGKFLNEYPQTPTEIPPGWDDWQTLAEVAYYDYVVNDNGAMVQYGSDPAAYLTDVLAGRAVDSIRESAPGGPFFLAVDVIAPHKDALTDAAVPAPRDVGAFASAPLPTSPSFDEADVSDKPAEVQANPRINRRDRAAMTEHYRSRLESLLAVDDLVADVVAELQATGELDNTILVFTSDNGYLQGEHRFQRGKGHPYEESVRVPLLIRGPGFPAGTSVGVPVANIDLAPTIAAAAGAVPLRDVDGVDLRDVVARPAAFADRSVLLERYAGGCFSGVRTSSAVYVRYTTGEEELYDLAHDPYQLESAHADPSMQALKAAMAARLAAIGPDPIPCDARPPGAAAGDLTVVEPGPSDGYVVQVPVTLSEPVAAPVTLGYRLVAGSAGESDAAIRTGTVAVPAGTTAAHVPVRIRADSVAEGPESLSVYLDPPTSGSVVLPGRSPGTVTILDRPPGDAAVAAGDVTVVEGGTAGSGPAVAYVAVSRGGDLAGRLTVRVTTADGTATAGADYEPIAGGRAVIPADRSGTVVAVPLAADDLAEPPETFTVTVAAERGTAGRAIGTVSILDDDP